MRQFHRRELLTCAAATGLVGAVGLENTASAQTHQGVSIPCRIHVGDYLHATMGEVPLKAGSTHDVFLKATYHSEAKAKKGDKAMTSVGFTMPLGPHAHVRMPIETNKDGSLPTLHIRLSKIDAGTLELPDDKKSTTKYTIKRLLVECDYYDDKDLKRPKRVRGTSCCFICDGATVIVPPGSSITCNGVVMKCEDEEPTPGPVGRPNRGDRDDH